MAMPSGNVVIQDKMQFPSAGGEIQQHHYRQQWYVDERDGLIGWLRSEFAAANAIIDSLCHHLRVIGEPGEYDMVIGAIQQRRCNWNQVLIMQQYFSVADVAYALQQVAWRRQQRPLDPVKVSAREVRKSGSGYRHGQRFEPAKEGYNSSVESYSNESNVVVTGSMEKGTPIVEKSEEHKSGGKVENVGDKGLASAEEKKDAIIKHQTDGNLKSTGSCEGSLSNVESEAVVANDGCVSDSKGNGSLSVQDQLQSHSLSTGAKTFVGNEMFDGKTVNVVDGLKLYDDLFDSTEVSKLVSLVNDLRVSGKKGQLQGSQAYIVSRRPMKGHGRELIQLGVPIADAPADGENMTAASKDMNVEPIPSLFQDIIERMVSSQVMTVKPDCCIVDFYNEGDHSQPHSWPSWYGRPVYMLFLTECEMTFGRVIASEHPGDYRGSVKLSLVPGSLLAMQGKSTDFARHALPSIRKQRILVTFTKSQPRKSLPSDAQRLASPAASSNWGPLPSRSPNHVRQHVVSKHYATHATTGVLPAPPIRPQIPAPVGMQPMFVGAPVVPPMPFPAPVPIAPSSAAWTAAPPPRHPPPRIPAPGTGVFLPPPGSGNSSQQSMETPTMVEKEDGKSNHSGTSASPKGKVLKQECNGHGHETQVEPALETRQDSDDKAAPSHT
ncbi:RNA demethylase ALKBH10B isoform X1 [Cajanus cajan]|uniref:RNA demethylase ALKBH10B isoform X1 n=1 Tax=Cajanus cajan TaxID=3821 RepID=UPI00098D9400|nr:RNA demethylase ALKBH10B isoform X1 [Cajanus cajan]